MFLRELTLEEMEKKEETRQHITDIMSVKTDGNIYLSMFCLSSLTYLLLAIFQRSHVSLLLTVVASRKHACANCSRTKVHAVSSVAWSALEEHSPVITTL
jgi:hypothetical protein